MGFILQREISTPVVISWCYKITPLSQLDDNQFVTCASTSIMEGIPSTSHCDIYLSYNAKSDFVDKFCICLIKRVSFYCTPKVNSLRYDMTLLSQPVETHYIFSYENFRIYFVISWMDHSFRANTISQRISMRMFSHITSCKYTCHSSICLLSEWCLFNNLWSLQKMRD